MAGVAACGGDDDDSSSSSASKTLCDDSQALKSSIDDLKNVDVVQNGTSAVSSAVTKVTDSATALIDAAKSEFKPEVDDLQSSLQTLGTSITNIPAEGARSREGRGDGRRDVGDEPHRRGRQGEVQLTYAARSATSPAGRAD